MSNALAVQAHNVTNAQHGQNAAAAKSFGHQKPAGAGQPAPKPASQASSQTAQSAQHKVDITA